VRGDPDGASKSDNTHQPEVSEQEDSKADDEEAAIELVLGASGNADAGSKVEVRNWKDLQEQLKDDIINAHKK
jgi:hypothetical protein